MRRLPPTSTLFPYTTLFRSNAIVSGVKVSASVALLCVSSSSRAETKSRTRCSNSSDRKSTRLNSSHLVISYAVFCLKKKKKTQYHHARKRNSTRDTTECHND